jgi:hypothetical protein
MNRKVKAIVTAAAIGAAMLTGPAAAQASAADDVRNCLEYFPTGGYVYVWYRYNDCGGRSIRSKAIVDWGPDSSCHTLSFDGEYTHTWSIGSLNRIAAC